jgi:hypothetical protein
MTELVAHGRPVIVLGFLALSWGLVALCDRR